MTRRGYVAGGLLVVSATMLYIAQTGNYFGRFINTFAPCVEAPGNSAACYATYDISVMFVAAAVGVVCLGVFVRELFRLRFGYRAVLYPFLAVSLFLLIGASVTRLSVHDAVVLTDSDAVCAHYMFEGRAKERMVFRVALMLGKGQVTHAHGPSSFEGRAYTLFRIPIGALYGRPGETYAVDCLPVAPQPALFAPVR